MNPTAIIKDEVELGSKKTAATKPFNSLRARQQIQTILDRDYGITIKNREAEFLIKTLLDNEVPTEDIVVASVNEVIEGQIKSFFLNLGLPLVPREQALSTAREMVLRIGQQAPKLVEFYDTHRTRDVLDALWNAHNGSIRESLEDDLEEISKDQLAKIGPPSEEEFAELVAEAKKKKRGDKGYITAGEKRGWFLVLEDPKARESWSVA